MQCKLYPLTIGGANLHPGDIMPEGRVLALVTNPYGSITAIMEDGDERKHIPVSTRKAYSVIRPLLIPEED